MDVDREKVKELLKCSLCTDYFHDPVTLSCQHTFCMACLGDTATTVVVKDFDIKIPNECPACGKNVFVPPCRNNTLQDLVNVFVEPEKLKLLQQEHDKKLNDNMAQKIYNELLKSNWRRYIETVRGNNMYQPIQIAGPMGDNYNADDQLPGFPEHAQNGADIKKKLEAEVKAELEDEIDQETTTVVDCLSCAVCKSVLCESVTLFCQHTFCRGCLENKNVTKCPMCNLTISKVPADDNTLLLLLSEATLDKEIKDKYDSIKLSREIVVAVKPILKKSVAIEFPADNYGLNSVGTIRADYLRPPMYYNNVLPAYRYNDCILTDGQTNSKIVKMFTAVQTHMQKWATLYTFGFLTTMAFAGIFNNKKN